MRTLLYEVTLHNPVTKKAYPEEFVGLRSIVGIAPGAQFYIEVKVNFFSIPPSQNGNTAQTVEIEVTVNGQDIGWVFDVTPEVPVCTFLGFPSSLGQITPFQLEANVPTILPETDKQQQSNEDENDWLEELFTVQVHATVIYAYEEGGDAEDPVPIDFFQYPADTLYYHSTGTMEALKAHYTQQKRSSAQALDVALSAAITAAEYEDFYADNYDPNDDSSNSDNDNDNDNDNDHQHTLQPSKLHYDDSDSDVQVVAHYPAPAKATDASKKPPASTRRPSGEQQTHAHYRNYDSSSSSSNNSKKGGDDDDIGDDEDDDDWWGTAAQPKANASIAQQKLRHQQQQKQQQKQQQQKQQQQKQQQKQQQGSLTTHNHYLDDHHHLHNSSNSSSKKRNFAVAAREYLQDDKDNDSNSDSDIDRPPTKRPVSAVTPASSAAQSKAAGVAEPQRPLQAAKFTSASTSASTSVPLPVEAKSRFTFASNLSMDSDSEGD